jgi:hypothetical protein
VLVNQALTILQFRGQTGPYLEPARGSTQLQDERSRRLVTLTAHRNPITARREFRFPGGCQPSFTGR